MAIIACPSCGKKISDKAPLCPYCKESTTEKRAVTKSKVGFSDVLDIQDLFSNPFEKKNPITLIIFGSVTLGVVILSLFVMLPRLMSPPPDALNVPEANVSMGADLGVRLTWMQILMRQRGGDLTVDTSDRPGLIKFVGNDDRNLIQVHAYERGGMVVEAVVFAKTSRLSRGAAAKRLAGVARQFDRNLDEWVKTNFDSIASGDVMRVRVEDDGRVFVMQLSEDDENTVELNIAPAATVSDNENTNQTTHSEHSAPREE